MSENWNILREYNEKQFVYKDISTYMGTYVQNLEKKYNSLSNIKS